MMKCTRNVKVMSSLIRYAPLLNESSGMSGIKTEFFGFPRIYKLRIVGVSFIILLSIGLITACCLHYGYYTNPAAFNRVVKNTASEYNKSKSGEHMIPHHKKKRLPQCIIIGTRKAGTRALLTYLNIHPKIVTQKREMHFFSKDTFYHKSLEFYRKQMPFSDQNQITIEKTPNYFTKEGVPERIYRMNKTISLLLVLRDPVVRTLSDYLQITQGRNSKNNQFSSFEEYILDSKGHINSSREAVKPSIYHKHLGRWLELFSLDQIHIIESQNLTKNPAGVMYDVEAFLSIEHKIKASNFYFNKTKDFYCVKKDALQTCLGKSKGRQHPDINGTVQGKLRRFFAPHNQILYKMIGRDFQWVEE